MWRWIGRRARLGIGSAASKLQPIQNSHPPMNLDPAQVQRCRTLQFSNLSNFLVSSKEKRVVLFLQSPKFFSHDSRDAGGFVESQFDSTDSGTNQGLAVASADDDVVEDGNRIPVKSESDNGAYLSLDFDETSLATEGFTSAGADDDSLAGEDDQEKEIEVREIDVEQLESLLSLLQSRSGNVDDWSLESSLDEMDLSLHEEFVVRVLETPLIPGDNLISFFKWTLKKPEFSATTWSLEVIVQAISVGLTSKCAYTLWDLIKEIGEMEKGVLTTEILNELISLFSKLAKGKAAFEVFNKFEEFGCVPNAETYYFTIEALSRRGIYEWACSVSEKMLDAGQLPDSDKVGKIISYLCKGGKAKDAHLIYLFAKEKDIYPSKASVNVLISSLCRGNETIHSALEMLEDFSSEDRKYAIKPFSYVIHGLCSIKDVEGAKRLLFKMIDAGPPPGNAIFNSIINSLSKVGDMEEAKKIMNLMEGRGLKPDVYTYSVIISSYVKGGEMGDACKVLAEAKKQHSKLNPVTYHSLIRGFCKLEQFDQAIKLLREMKKYGVQPNADEYNKMIQSLCLKALDWGTAEKLLEEMKENGLHLNGITKALITAVKEIEEEEVGSREVAIGA
ncbi:pentatricopeptide repeat-containing protein At3g02650, mitochondrial [Diospyros lotus]|uniref:pentatricopeptide repeat-containing protein At3g02650, mitochondrial n=1 Tax=Diospyros lotus TaxID=55363 RepID=UPI002252B4A0|nr:pentatricopeptide repeat-containing protein At3g02650, mitochondrial [Diospyros lotus]